MKDVYGFIYVFNWNPDGKSSSERWLLSQIGVQDGVGRVLGEGAYSWIERVTGTRVDLNNDACDTYYRPTPGRLVVWWSWDRMSCGLFSPPSSCEWVMHSSIERLIRDDGWLYLIEGAYWCRDVVLADVRKRLGAKT